MARKNKRDMVSYAVQFLLVSVLIFLVFLMISHIEGIQGNSRVVNYTGIIRGTTQRIVKLELSNKPADELIPYIDEILRNLQTGSGAYDLDKLDDAAYLQKLSQLSSAWDSMKQEIYRFRQNGTESTALLRLSEEFFILANDTVSAAEAYSEGEAKQLRLHEAALITIVVLILLIIARQIASAFLLHRKNKELNKMVHIDAHTGLPNKGRCEQVIFEGIYEPGKQYACVMFDLNNLKQTNDLYGHKAGDELIYSFAGILLSTATEKVFVGRYGGDEFIAVLSDTTDADVQVFLNNIDAKISYFNDNKTDVPISVAHGYAIAAADESFSLQSLLMLADEKMYKNKADMKSKPAGTSV